jgi:hypothetical protein
MFGPAFCLLNTRGLYDVSSSGLLQNWRSQCYAYESTLEVRARHHRRPYENSFSLLELLS